MKSILVLRHVPHETMGTLQTALDEAGLKSRYVDLFAEVPEGLDLASAAGLVVLGGPMNVDQTDRYPFLAPEVHWIRQAVRSGLPVLGICLGSQLLAKALGSRVFPNGVKEIGWYPIELTSAAAQDRLFRTCWEEEEAEGERTASKRVTVFQWHGDTFDLPAEAVPLARGELCAQQAFRYGERAYALQFHLEMTQEMLDDWLAEPLNCAELAELDYIHPQEIRRRVPRELPELQRLARRMFGQFAQLCCGSTESPSARPRR